MIVESRIAIHDRLAGPWWHVLTVAAPVPAASANGDFAAVLPAARTAEATGRSMVIGWLSRGDGAPLELITTVGPAGPAGKGGTAPVARGKHAAPPRISVAPQPAPLPFPPGACGLAVPGGCAADLDRLVWVPCPAVRDLSPQRPEPVPGPSLFETALVALMRRPFGWLVVAGAVDPAERSAAEPGDLGDAGLWSVRVLAGASGPDELDVLAPLLAGAADLGAHPYRLRSATSAQNLDDALTSSRPDPGDGAQSPFLVTGGTIAALAGLPRQSLPGLNVTGTADPGTRPAGASRDRPAGASIELAVALEPGRGPLRMPVAALGHGVLVTGSAGTGPSRTVRNMLAQLTALGLPWLVVDAARSGYETVTGREGPPVTVINPCDPDAIPLTLSPLAPEPGYPLQAHMALVSRLLDVAFGADELFSLAVSLALPRVYEAAGWDLLTGRPAHRAPGRVPAPAVPRLGELHDAVTGVIGEAGYDRRTRARLRALAGARFGPLRSGSAGRFLDGGHPADLGALLRGPAVLAVHDIGAGEDRALVSGALLIRLAEHLRLRPGQPGSPLRHVLVLGEARSILGDQGEGRPATRAAERLAALLAEFGAHGEGIVLTEPRPARLVPDVSRNAAVRIVHRVPSAHGADAGEQAADLPLLAPEVAVLLPGDAGPPRWGRIPPPGRAGPPGRDHPGGAVAPGDVTPPVSGRRSAACGRRCREGRACQLGELREAELLAAAPELAWLRVWTEAFLLAFLTDNPLPAVPAPLCRRWRGLGARARECLLARVVDHQAGIRSAALRASYEPSRFAQVVASAAAIRLDRAGAGAGAEATDPAGAAPSATRPGPAWVIPQLRWLHEVERLCPFGGPGLAPADHAPPLDFDLPALPDWPGIRAGQRIWALRRHPLSMELAANRRLAWTALVGEVGPVPFAVDLAQVMPGVDHAQALRHTAALMQVSGGISTGPGWLEAVLSWPRRFVTFPGTQRLPGDAADWPPG